VTRRQAAYLLGLLALANLCHYAVRNVAFPLYGALRLRFGASEVELGLVGTSFMVPHAVAAVLVGWLGDRVDRRRLMAAGIALWSASAALAAMAQSMEWFLIARGLAGIGTAACVPVANALICDAYPPARAARAVSIFNLGLCLGGVVGVVLGEGFGFPLALWLVAAPGLLLAAFIAVAPAPTSSPVPSSASFSWFRRGGPALIADVRMVLAVRAFRWTAVGAVLMAFAAGGYVAWFVELLHHKGMHGREATGLFGAAVGGGLCGVLTGASVADRLRRSRADGRQLAIALGFAVAVPFAVLAIELPTGGAFYLACWALMFFISWYHAPLAAAVDELAPPGLESTAQGLYIFLMHLCGTAPSSFAVGLLAVDLGLERALYVPTAAMALAALTFVFTARSVRRATAVLQRRM
jgi:MFS transporter, Spinster family, sphingosine-1-phosphate transporter